MFLRGLEEIWRRHNSCCKYLALLAHSERNSQPRGQPLSKTKMYIKLCDKRVLVHGVPILLESYKIIIK